jgi:hypothetical protein
MLEKFFSRQRNAVVGGKAADSERWDRELADDMFGVQYQTVEAFGKDAADRIGGRWDQERTAAYVRKRSDAVAQSLNAETAQRLAADGAVPDEVFGEPRVQEFSRTHTTFAVNWAIQEAAHQNGA